MKKENWERKLFCLLTPALMGDPFMKRFLPHCLWAAGLVVVLDGVGRYCGHSLPYQDPTPELLAVQHEQLHSARLIMTAGALIFLSGLLLLLLLSKLWPRTK